MPANKIILFPAPPASERRENDLKDFQNSYLEASEITWPGLSYVCHIRSIVDCVPGFTDEGTEQSKSLTPASVIC